VGILILKQANCISAIRWKKPTLAPSLAKLGRNTDCIGETEQCQSRVEENWESA
jgi:hypothetical protein